MKKQIAWYWNRSDAITCAYGEKGRTIKAMISVGAFGYAVFEGCNVVRLPD